MTCLSPGKLTHQGYLIVEFNRKNCRVFVCGKRQPWCDCHSDAVVVLDIAAWLARQGLDKHIEAFAANEIDLDAPLRYLFHCIGESRRYEDEAAGNLAPMRKLCL